MRASVMVGSGHRKGRRRAPVWRLLTVLAVVSLVIVGLPVMANAGPPGSFAFTGTDVSCETDTEFLGFFIAQEDGEMWLDLFYDEFEVISLGGSTGEFSFDGTNLSAEVEMYEDFFAEPVGTAFIEATFEPIGEPETGFDRFRDGNRWVEVQFSSQDLAAVGSAALEGYFNFDLSECAANTFTEQVWQTNPNAYAARFGGQFAECALEGPDAFGFMYAELDDRIELFVLLPEETALFGETDDFVFTDTELSAVVELFEEESGEGPFEALVEATLEPTGNVFVEDLLFQNIRVKNVAEELAVAGTVTVDGHDLDMVECFAESYGVKVHESFPAGPKPTGRTPVNDAPDGALSLEDRGTTNAQTIGAVNAPEAECLFSFDGENGEEPEEFPLPIGKTLWYTFEGTGGEVSVDSAGSNFDTIVGVYDAGMTQIACVDDVVTDTSVTLQAAATVATEEGETYYVQIGGFGFWDEEALGEFGRIRLNMS